jgi:hypothetical protein
MYNYTNSPNKKGTVVSVSANSTEVHLGTELHTSEFAPISKPKISHIHFLKSGKFLTILSIDSFLKLVMQKRNGFSEAGAFRQLAVSGDAGLGL